jgi:uncharacterized membrane protein YraQ (UPF0718 family)
VGLVEDVLFRYLYKEDIEDLARERGLSVTGTKEELVNELLWSDRFDPDDALAFLNLSELRRLCREYRLPSAGNRDTLLDHIHDAIEQDRQSVVRRSVSNESRGSNSTRTHPDTTGPWTIVGVVAAAIVSAFLYWSTAVIGLAAGGGLSILLAAGIAVGMLRTSHRWIPWLARQIHPLGEG